MRYKVSGLHPLLIILAVALASVLFVAACGGGSEPTAAPVDTQAAAEAQAAAAEAQAAAAEAQGAAAQAVAAAEAQAAAAEAQARRCRGPGRCLGLRARGARQKIRGRRVRPGRPTGPGRRRHCQARRGGEAAVRWHTASGDGPDHRDPGPANESGRRCDHHPPSSL